MPSGTPRRDISSMACQVSSAKEVWNFSGLGVKPPTSAKKRQRLSPAMWRANGFDKKIGPLIMLKSVNGHPLLAIENVGVDLSGRKRSAKSLKKSGAPRKRQVRKELVIAFVGIPRTARAARINLTSILESARAEMPAILSSELAKEGN